MLEVVIFVAINSCTAKDPAVIVVATKFVIVELFEYKAPVLIEEVARIVPTVIPVASIDPVLVAVATTLEIVARGA